MNVQIDSFLDYLRYERNYSEYTVGAYSKDLRQFEDFVKEKKEGIFVPEEVDADIVRNWIICLLDNDISPVSVNRKLSSLKSFFKFLMKQGIVSVNPLRFVTGPKTKKPLPTFVKEKDMEELLDGDGFDEDFEGIRDRLILEMLYDTGVRRSELLGIQDTDIDLPCLCYSFLRPQTAIRLCACVRICPAHIQVSALESATTHPFFLLQIPPRSFHKL